MNCRSSHRHHRRAAILAYCTGALLFSLTLTPSAHAQSAPPLNDEGAAVSMSYERGEELYKLARFEEAFQEFSKLYERIHNPELFHNLGACKFMLKEYDLAIFFFRNYLRYAPQGEKRAEAMKAIEMATRMLDQGLGVDSKRPASAPVRPLVQEKKPESVVTSAPVTPKPAPPVKTTKIAAKPNPPSLPPASLPSKTPPGAGQKTSPTLAFEKRDVGFFIAPKLGPVVGLEANTIPLRFGFLFSTEVGYRPSFWGGMFAFSIEPMLKIEWGKATYYKFLFEAREVFVGASVLASFNRTVGPGLVRVTAGPIVYWYHLVNSALAFTFDTATKNTGGDFSASYLWYLGHGGALGVDGKYLITPVDLAPYREGGLPRPVILHTLSLRLVYLFAL